VNQIRKRLTYANVMSSIAVFLLLGGGAAFAAGKLAKNSVGSKQIKKNAVTSAKIKKNAVTTAKIKNGAVSGAKINLGTLGTVPNASHAGSADSATNATNATNAQNFSRYFNLGLKKASVGQTEVPLGAIGPFTFVGDCVDNGGGEFEANIYAKTSIPDSAAYSYEESWYWELDPDERAEITYSTASTDPYGYFYNYYDGWALASPNGSTFLSGEAKAMVHVFGSDCAFLVYGFNNTP
jgi:hypothetical protein